MKKKNDSIKKKEDSISGWMEAIKLSSNQSRKARDEAWEEMLKHIDEPLSSDILNEYAESCHRGKSQSNADMLSMINEIRRYRLKFERIREIIERKP